MKQGTEDLKNLTLAIVEGMQRLKAQDITLIDLETIQHTECSQFIICHGTSTTQADAIAHSVEETVKELTGELVWHRDGYRNALWILLDYGDIMVHVFQKEAREFYNLEGLWADAEMKQLEADN
jgi:ribosome-associated protein